MPDFKSVKHLVDGASCDVKQRAEKAARKAVMTKTAAILPPASMFLHYRCTNRKGSIHLFSILLSLFSDVKNGPVYLGTGMKKMINICHCFHGLCLSSLSS